MSSLWYRFIIWGARMVFLLTGGISVRNRNRVPRKGKLLVAPNHCSHLDPPLVAVTIPRQLRFMAKEELFNVRILGPLIRSVGAFPVKRGEGDTEAVRMALGSLSKGAAMLIFPEGTRGDGHTLGPVNRGVVLLAKRSQAAVLPILIVGTASRMPKGASGIGRGRVQIWFGEPFCYKDIATQKDDKENRVLFAKEWQNRIIALGKEAGIEIKASSTILDSTAPGLPD